MLLRAGVGVLARAVNAGDDLHQQTHHNTDIAIPYIHYRIPTFRRNLSLQKFSGHIAARVL